MDQNPSSSKADRKTIEKNRRNHMKNLYSTLSSLVPRQAPREVVSVPDQLESATTHIRKMQMKLEKLKEKKNSLMMEQGVGKSSFGTINIGEDKLPKLDIRGIGSTALEIVLITGLNCQFMFGETIRLIHEEGAEVVGANFSVMDDLIFHTIHLKMGESASEHEAARISERLRKMVYDNVN